jgi:hypothetical protein
MSGDSSIFRMDERFVEQLRDRLLNAKKYYFGSDSGPTLVAAESVPSAEQIEELILALHGASTQREEGRLSQPSVMFAEPLPLNYMALVFASPKRLSVEEVRKIAPAVAPPDGQIGVWPSGEDGVLHIWGLQTTDLMRVLFKIIDPGRVVVSHLGFQIAEITGQRAGFISRAWDRRALELMSTLGADGTMAGEMLSYLSIYATQEILRRVRLLGHGGTIIFVPPGRRWERSVEPVFYACELRLSEMERIAKALEGELREAGEGKPAGEGLRHTILHKGVELIGSHQYKAFVGAAARRITHLSTVDGATILSENFEVLAFGAKLKAPRRGAKAATVTRFIPLEGTSDGAEVPLDQEFRGTRHLSAAQFVFNNPGAIAFVVSQDGGITGLFMGEEEGEEPQQKLIAFKGLELVL